MMARCSCQKMAPGRSGGSRANNSHRLISRERQCHHGAERHPAEMPAPGRQWIGERGERENTGNRQHNPMPRRFRVHPGRGNQQHAAADPRHRAGLPHQPDQEAQASRLNGSARQYFGFAEHTVYQRNHYRGDPRHLQQEIAHCGTPYRTVCWIGQARSVVNTVVYGALSQVQMTDKLSATDWLDQELRTLAESGFTALKAEPLAKAMGVSRGSFYWHFADIGAYHAAILERWREVATEQIIAGVEAAKNGDMGKDPLAVLLKLTFGSK